MIVRTPPPPAATRPDASERSAPPPTGPVERIDRTRAECNDAGAEDLASEYLDELAALVGVGEDYCREVALAAEATEVLAHRPIARLLWKRDYLARAHAMRWIRLRRGGASGNDSAAAVAAR